MLGDEGHQLGIEYIFLWLLFLDLLKAIEVTLKILASYPQIRHAACKLLKLIIAVNILAHRHA